MKNQKKISKKPIKKNKIWNPFLNPTFRFIFITISLMLLLLLYVSQASITDFFVNWTSISLHWILQVLHIKTRLTGNILLLLDGSQIKFQIIPDCTVIFPFIILFSMIIGYPSRIQKKLFGILIAFFYTLLFNYIRLVLLFVIGRKSVHWFEVAHIFIWQVSFVLLIVGFFFWWMQWQKNIKKK